MEAAEGAQEAKGELEKARTWLSPGFRDLLDQGQFFMLNCDLPFAIRDEGCASLGRKSPV